MKIFSTICVAIGLIVLICVAIYLLYKLVEHIDMKIENSKWYQKNKEQIKILDHKIGKVTDVIGVTITIGSILLFFYAIATIITS